MQHYWNDELIINDKNNNKAYAAHGNEHREFNFHF